MPLRSIASALFAGLALSAVSPAFAAVQVQSSIPAANANASSVRELSLTFSEAVADRSGVDIVMTAMRGMTNHQPMKIAGFKTALSPDGKTLKVTLPRALPAGTYQVTWHAISRDGNKVDGSYSFSTK